MDSRISWLLSWRTVGCFGRICVGMDFWQGSEEWFWWCGRVCQPRVWGAPDNEQQRYEGQRNSFLFSLLVLSSYIVKADGRVMHSEMETVRAFLRQNFGEVAVQEGEQIMRRLFQQQDMMGPSRYKATISEACAQISRHLAYEQRLQLLNYLVVIAKADGQVPVEEMDALRFVSIGLRTLSSRFRQHAFYGRQCR